MALSKRSYISLRRSLLLFLPAMSSLGVWPLAWTALQGGQGLVLYGFLALTLVLGPAYFMWDWELERDLEHGAWSLLDTIVLVSSRVLQIFVFTIFLGMSIWGLGSLMALLLEAVGVGASGPVAGYFAMLSLFLYCGFLVFPHQSLFSRRVRYALGLLAWIFLTAMAAGLAVYVLRLPVFLEAFKVLTYPDFVGFKWYDVLKIYGLVLLLAASGWGLKSALFAKAGNGRHKYRAQSFVLWAFAWIFLLLLILSPFIFRLNFGTPSLETLFFHLPRLFLNLPSGVMVGASILSIVTSSSLLMSYLIYSKGSVWWVVGPTGRSKRRGQLALLGLGFSFHLAAMALGGLENLSWLDGFLAALLVGFYPIYGVLMVVWKLGRRRLDS